MNRKPATMREVAQRAGVSPATVSNVLGQRKPVDAGLAERVRRAAAELDYAVDRAASQLRSGKTRVVAIVVPSLENPFFTSLIAAVERSVAADGYDIVVASSGDDGATERSRLAALLSWRPAGVVVVPCADSFGARDLLVGARVPYVVVDRVAADLAADVVTVDNDGAAGAAARHLLGFGHRDLLVVASSLALANIRERCDGVQAVWRAAGLAAPAVLEVGLSFDEIAERIDAHLVAHGRPTAVLALTNFATLGVIAAFSRLGIAIPDDVSLVGFDDYAWMGVSTPSITAVAQPVDRMGAAAWERLRTRIGGGGEPPARLKLNCRLEIRQSTKAVGPPLGIAGAAKQEWA